MSVDTKAAGATELVISVVVRGLLFLGARRSAHSRRNTARGHDAVGAGECRLVAVVIVAAVALLLVWRHERLKARFGPEYDRAVRAKGAWRGESELEQRARRVGRYHIRALSADERQRFSTAWRQLQSRFVDDPAGAVTEADTLVTDLMACRGYPMTEFDRRAEDLSVDHPNVVSHYREAHVVVAPPAGAPRAASTEDLRQAVVHYRALFDELLDVATPAPARRPA